MPFRPKKFNLILLAGALLGLGAAGQAHAQAKLDARYAVTLGGVKLGEGSWAVDVGEDRFSAEASGATSGLARMFSSGKGNGSSRGVIKNDQFVPASYAMSIRTGKRGEDLRLTLSDGAVKDVSIVPQLPEPEDRIPVTEAHRRRVFDPMTGALLRVAGNGDLMKPEVCRQHTPIFDGRMRYDLTLAYKRMEQVKVPGYEGPALVCAIYFAPLAGYVPTRAAIKYLIDQRDMETWLVPIAGTRVMVPIRVQVPTPLGLGVMEATAFNVMPQPRRASLKTQ